MSLQAASIAELEAACPGASQDFILGQLKSQQSAQAAATAYAAGLLQQLRAAQSQVTALQSAYAAASKPSDRERELQSQLEFARKARGSHAPVKEKPGSIGGGTAKAQCEALRDELVAGGMDRLRAWSKVMDDHPDLRQQMIDEANGRAA
jgi:hypothetical protein